MDTSATELLSPYEQIGAADGIARVVGRFYDLMETDPAYAALRALTIHPAAGSDTTPS